MEIGSLIGQLTLNDNLSSGLDLAAAKVEEFAESFDGMSGAVVASAGVIATAIAAVAATTFGLVEHAASAADAVEAFSIKTGIAVENVGPLQFAVTAAGGSLDELNSTLMRMTMKEAADTTGKFSGALQDLGINAETFKNMDAEAKLLALGEGFRTGAINATNMADSMALMGRGGANLIPVLEKMTPELMAIAEQSAILWTPDTIEAARQFNVDTSILEQSFANIATRIGAELLPVMSDLVDQFAKSPDFINAIVTTMDLFAHSLGYAVLAAGYLTTGFISLAAGAVNIGILLGEGGVQIDKFFLAILNGLSYIPGFSSTVQGAITSVTQHLAQAQANVDSMGNTYTKLVTVGGAVYDGSQKVGNALLSVGTATDSAKEKVDNLAGSDTAAAAAAAKHAQAVQTLEDSLTGSGKAMSVIQDAFTELYDSGQLYGDTLERMLPELDKLTNAHIKLTDAQKETYVEGVQLKAATDAYEQGLLQTQNVTLAYIETQKAHGLSMQNIATLLGVSKQALTDWETKLKETDTFQKDSLKSSEAIWTEYAKVVTDALNLTQYEKSKQAISDWYTSQLTQLDAWKTAQLEAGKTETAAIEQEYQTRLSALQTLDQAKVDILNKDTLALDTSTQNYYQRTADIAKATYNDALALSGGFVTAHIQDLKNAADAAQIAADQFVQDWTTAASTATTAVMGFGAAGVSASNSVAAAANAAAAAVARMASPQGSAQEQKDLASVMAQIGPVAPGGFGLDISAYNAYQAKIDAGMAALGYVGTNKSFDVGGPVPGAGPMAATVHGGEYVVPKDGALVKGGGGNTYNINVAPSLVASAAEIARVVGQAIVTYERQTGVHQ